VGRDPARRRPAVFARLRAEEERRVAHRVPPGYVRLIGWAISLALVTIAVVLLALQGAH